MIVLLSCSMSWLKASNNSSTGGSDSIHVSVEDIRTVNSKLIELKYEKEINSKLKTIVKNDSTIIENLGYKCDSLSIKTNKLTKQRNTAIGGGALFLLLFLLKLL